MLAVICTTCMYKPLTWRGGGGSGGGYGFLREKKQISISDMGRKKYSESIYALKSKAKKYNILTLKKHSPPPLS